jgi:hypothetical protein
MFKENYSETLSRECLDQAKTSGVLPPPPGDGWNNSLRRACCRGNVDAADDLWNITPEDGNAYVSWAAISGRISMMRWLQKRVVSLDACDLSGNTPLIYAASHGQKSSVMFLLQEGASKSRVNINGHTAAGAARLRGHLALAAAIDSFSGYSESRTALGTLAMSPMTKAPRETLLVVDLSPGGTPGGADDWEPKRVVQQVSVAGDCECSSMLERVLLGCM